MLYHSFHLIFIIEIRLLWSEPGVFGGNEMMAFNIARYGLVIRRFCAVGLAFLMMNIICACGGGAPVADDKRPEISDPGNASESPDIPPVEDLTQWEADDFEHVYDVGPGRAFAEPGDVPWESLQPSTLVRIYYRDIPYRAKWVVNVAGTAEKPVVILGMADNDRRPCISGENAVTRQALDYWNEVRSVIKVGGSSTPDNPAGPSHIHIQGLEIRSARPSYSFSDDAGSQERYSQNAAAIHVEEGEDITIADCILRDAGNGIFSGSASSRLIIRANLIYDNGIDGSIYHHNSYTESQGILFERNHYGPLRSGCLGNNLKDRSCGTVIRYNWIEGGNRQLDLVETDYAHIADDPSYQETFVYGNLLIEPDGAGNSQILHYGGDGGDVDMYRRGTLYFYHNTVVSTRSGNTTLLRLSTTDVNADVVNNILYPFAGGSRLAITSGNGQTRLFGNWLPEGWQITHEAGLEEGAALLDLGNQEGLAPGFVDEDDQDFHLATGSDACGNAEALPAAVLSYPPDHQYVVHRQYEPRHFESDIGAFECF